MDDVNEFFGRRNPVWVHRSDYEFVDPIDWGQIEKDRQEQIDNAYRYIANGIEKNRYFSIDKWSIMSKAIEILLPFMIKGLLWLIGVGSGIAVLDYFHVVKLGLF